MFQLLALVGLCYTTLLVAAEDYHGNAGYPGGVPGDALYPGDPGYRGTGIHGAGYHDSYQFCVASAEDPDADCIRGEAGLNYPVYSQVPPTGFACQSHPHPGYYADQDTQCQVFHICQHDGRHDSFLCPNGTIFNQQYFVCDWWYNVDCATASSFYGINSELYQDPRFYGGAYHPAAPAGHAHGLDHAGGALPNGYGSHRASLAPYGSGHHPTGYPASLSRAYGPNPLLHPESLGYGPQGAPLSPFENRKHPNGYTASLASTYGPNPLHSGYGPQGATLSPYENGKYSNGHSASLASAYGPNPLHSGYGPQGAPLSPYENGKYFNGHSASLPSAYGPALAHKTKVIPGSAALAKGY